MKIKIYIGFNTKSTETVTVPVGKKSTRRGAMPQLDPGLCTFKRRVRTNQ